MFCIRDLKDSSVLHSECIEFRTQHMPGRMQSSICLILMEQSLPLELKQSFYRLTSFKFNLIP